MNKNELHRRWRNLALAAMAAAALIAVIYILSHHGIGIPCLFHRVTGLLCPGCGNTRAALALLQLDISGALKFNLLFPVEFFYIGWVAFFSGKAYLRGGRFAYKSPAPWLDISILAAVILWGILRNVIPC